MAVDGGGGHIHPNAGRSGERGNDAAEQAGGSNARIVDFAAVFLVVAAVHAASGKVDADVSAFKGFNPCARIRAIPVHGLPGRGVGRAGEHGDVVAGELKMAREHLPHVSTAAGQNDAKGASGHGSTSP